MKEKKVECRFVSTGHGHSMRVKVISPRKNNPPSSNAHEKLSAPAVSKQTPLDNKGIYIYIYIHILK